MTRREKLLAAGILTLLLLWGATSAWSKYQIAVAARNTQLDVQRQALEDLKLEETRARIASEQLNSWRDRSLPIDRQQAQALYRDWLLERMNDSELTMSIDLKANTPGTAAYDTVGYTVRAEGDLAHLARFLYDFYQTDQLHKITVLQLRPASTDGKLDITLHVEGLMVRGASLTDSLSAGSSERLVLESADAYRESIAGRNVFSPYRPQRGPRVASAPPDDSSRAFVTSIFLGDPKQLWITLDTGRVLRLREGQRINVPGFRGRLVEIRSQDAIVDLRDERRLIRIGKSLSDATKLAEGDGG